MAAYSVIAIVRRSVSVTFLVFLTLAETPQTQLISDPADLLRYLSGIRHSDAPGALRLADRALATTRGSPADRWRLQLLDAELNLDTLGGPDEKFISATLNRLKVPVPPDVPPMEAKARFASIKGYVAQIRQDWEGAYGLYREAASGIRALNDDHCWKAELLVHHQAQTLRHLDQPHGNVSILLKRAAEESDSCPDKYWKTLAPNIQGNVFNDQFQYDRAVAPFQTCFGLAKANQFTQLIAFCAANAALAYYNLGDYDNSLQMSDQADKYYALIKPLTNKQRNAWGVTKGHRARTYLAVDRLDEAARLYKEAMLTAAETNDRDYLIRWRDELASVYIKKSDLKTAEDLNRQVLNEGNSGEIAVIADARLNAARLARLKGDFQQALNELALVQRDSQRKPSMALKLIWNMHTERAETFAALDRVSEARHEFDAALRTADTVYLDLGKDYDRLTYISQLRSVYQSYVGFLIDRKLKDEALALAESSHARLLAEKLNDTGTKSSSATFAATARARNAVILSYFTAPARSYMWVTTPSRSEVFVLPSEVDLRGLVKRHNEPILEERSIAEDQAGRELYDRLIAPAAHSIPANGNVVVIPDGPLCDLNFETLIPPGPAPHYWIESATVTISPSLRLLAAEAPRAIEPRSVLAVGSAVQVDAGLPPIGDNELQAIKGLYGAKCDLMSGTRATPMSFTNAHPEHYSLIHFSAHAIPYPQSPLDSYIALSPGTDSGYRLYAYELARIHLAADLVTLSACQSAGAKNVPGEGLVGLTWAVLGAGAHNVIASLWPVAAPATAGLMNRFYVHLHSGETPDRALRAAKLELIAKLRATPYEWAAFQLYSR